jgi:hypothetical protein
MPAVNSPLKEEQSPTPTIGSVTGFEQDTAALAAASERGVQVGNPKNLEEWNRTRKHEARHFADQHSNLIWSLYNKG